MILLAADLRTLANLPATATGRRVTISLLVGLGLLALMSWWLARTIVDDRQLLQLIGARHGEDTMLGLLGYGLLTCPMVATWLGLATAQRQLFETPELMLWRQAPIASFRGPMQVFVRAALISTLWSTALAAPFLIALLQKSPAPFLAYALVPVAIISCTLPLLATLLTVQIIMVRFLSGRWLRLILSTVAALASVGFTIWLLLTLFANGQDRLQDVIETTERNKRLPLTVHAAAVMLANASNRLLTLQHIIPVLVWLGSSLSVFALASLLHPRAHERFLESSAPTWRRSKNRWPSSLANNVRKKEFAQVIQQPGALIGFLVFAVLVFALARERVLVDNILNFRLIPLELRNIAAMLTWWFLAVLLVLYAHMGRLALWDGAQWPLYMASPAKPTWILKGKLQAISGFLLWPLLLVMASGIQVLQAEPSSILWFFGFAFAGSLAALGVVAVIGTWPRLMRPDAEGQILQGGKSFLAAMVMVTVFQLTMLPAVIAWRWIAIRARTQPLQEDLLHDTLIWALITAVTYGSLLALTGLWIGAQNYRRLLAPR